MHETDQTTDKSQGVLPPSRPWYQKVLFVFGIFYLLTFLLPRPFWLAAKDFAPEEVEHISITYFDRTVDETGSHSVVKEYTIDPQSESYQTLLDLLSSTWYRKQFANLAGGGNTSGYSISLNPHVSIYFTQPEGTYEISLFGKDMPMGPRRRRTDYSPLGGMEFQTEVVAFLAENGTLVQTYEP